MVKKRGKQTLLTAGAVLFVLLVLIGVVALLQGLNGDPQSAREQTLDTSQTTEEPVPQPLPDETEDVTPTQADDAPEGAEATQLDPATVATVDIEPMELRVSYVRGVGGFEYLVQRTTSGTEYVEFKSPELVGSKCTDDQGAFATILESPNDNEASTISSKTTVEGTEYGLSLVASNCTNNVELLERYQASFSDAFSLLKKIQ